MKPLPLALLVLAAWIHAGWNYQLKKSSRRMLVLWWALALSALALAPTLFWIPLPVAKAWAFVVASAVAQAVYLALLSWAYSLADFSLVYPVARGTAPLFLLLWSTLLLREPLQTQGVVGVVVLSLGLMVLGYTGRVAGLAIPVALSVALMISTYTAIDGQAVKICPAFSYFVAEWCLSVVVALPPLLWRYGWPQLLSTWREERAAVVWVGLGSAAAYALALQAYALAPVGYAGAVREVSVVVAAWLGWKAAGESAGRWRMFASLLIFVGIVLIAAA